ncbi:MAG: hypothetical protein ED557_03065 [Balneola sp.]|nr:MAG: hypothetical protein ED557_03065 [Balneola sp.]
MSNFVVLNGEVLPESEVLISPINRGMMYGDGFFATFRSYKMKFLELDAHFNRLKEGANYLGIDVPFGFEDFRLKLSELLKANNETDIDSIIRVQCWREGERGYSTDSKRGEWLSSSSALKELKDSVSLSTVSIKSISSEALARHIKLSNGLNYILAAKEAKSRGADDALMTTSEGLISETTIANLFWVKGETIYTPSIEADLYPGITRRIIIELLEQSTEFEVVQGKFRWDALLDSDCVFVTNSIRELLPVSRIDSQEFLTTTPAFEAIKEIFSNYRDQNLG